MWCEEPAHGHCMIVDWLEINTMTSQISPMPKPSQPCHTVHMSQQRQYVQLNKFMPTPSLQITCQQVIVCLCCCMLLGHGLHLPLMSKPWRHLHKVLRQIPQVKLQQFVSNKEITVQYYYRKKRFQWHNVKQLQGQLMNTYSY